MSEDALDRERERLIASRNEQSGQFDRALMTLSAGSLGLSLAFVKDIAPHPGATWAIKSSWVCLAVSLGVVVASFVASTEVHDRYLNSLDDAQLKLPRWVGSIVTWMNRGAAVAFVVGASLLVYFASQNI
jgi:hypothetical protein